MQRIGAALIVAAVILCIAVGVAWGLLGSGLPEGGGLAPRADPPASSQTGAMPLGESLEYAIMWGNVHAGDLSLTLLQAEVSNDRRVIHAMLRLTSGPALDPIYKVRDRIESWMVPHSGQSLRFRRSVREGTFKVYRAEETLVYDPARERLCPATAGDSLSEPPSLPAAGPVLDPLGVIYAVRARPLEPSEQRTVRVATRTGLSQLTLQAGAATPLQIEGLGVFEALPLSIQPEKNAEELELFLRDGTLRIWVERMTNAPLRIEITGLPLVGTLQAVLRRATESPLTRQTTASQ